MVDYPSVQERLQIEIQCLETMLETVGLLEDAVDESEAWKGNQEMERCLKMRALLQDCLANLRAELSIFVDGPEQGE